MLTIRLNRVGKNRRAAFRLAVQEHTVAPGGRHVELVGSYDPHSKKAVLKVDRIKYWMSQGAQVSDSAYNLLVREKAIEGGTREKKIKKPVVEAKPEETKTEAVKADSTSSPQAEEPKAEEVKAEVSSDAKALEDKPAEVVTEEPVVEESKVEKVPKA